MGIKKRSYKKCQEVHVNRWHFCYISNSGWQEGERGSSYKRPRKGVQEKWISNPVSSSVDSVYRWDTGKGNNAINKRKKKRKINEYGLLLVAQHIFSHGCALVRDTWRLIIAAAAVSIHPLTAQTIGADIWRRLPTGPTSNSFMAVVLREDLDPRTISPRLEEFLFHFAVTWSAAN